MAEEYSRAGGTITTPGLWISDCLLHVEHHGMDDKCLKAAGEFYRDSLLAGFSAEETTNRYHLRYESQLLTRVMRGL